MGDAMDTLRAMFSGMDDSVLTAALGQANGRMEQAVELLLNYSPANPPAVRSLPAAPSPPTPTDPGQVASRIEQIDLSIASLTSQKIDCVQREQYAAAQSLKNKIDRLNQQRATLTAQMQTNHRRNSRQETVIDELTPHFIRNSGAGRRTQLPEEFLRPPGWIQPSKRRAQESRDAQFALQLQNQQLHQQQQQQRRQQSSIPGHRRPAYYTYAPDRGYTYTPNNGRGRNNTNNTRRMSGSREPPPRPPPPAQPSGNQVNKFFKKLGGGAKNAWGKFTSKFKKRPNTAGNAAAAASTTASGPDNLSAPLLSAEPAPAAPAPAPASPAPTGAVAASATADASAAASATATGPTPTSGGHYVPPTPGGMGVALTEMTSSSTPDALDSFRAPAEGNYDFLQDMQHDDSDEEVCF